MCYGVGCVMGCVVLWGGLCLTLAQVFSCQIIDSVVLIQFIPVYICASNIWPTGKIAKLSQILKYCVLGRLSPNVFGRALMILCKDRRD